MSVRFNPVIARSLFICTLVLGAFPSGVSAQCRLEIVRGPSEIHVNYDPFQPATAPERISLTLHNPSPDPCLAEVAFVDEHGSPRPQIEVARTGLGLEIRSGSAVSEAPEPGVFRVQVGANLVLDALFDLVLVGEGVVEAGLYHQDLVLRIRDQRGLSPGRDFRFPLALRSLPRAQLNIAGGLGSFGEGPSISRVDFGVAETGKTERLFVQSRTNAPARIRITSANRGLLQPLVDAGTAPGLTYTAILANSPLDLTRAAFVDVDPPRTYQGASLELILTLGPISGARAGAYSDELTFEISTL